MAELARHLVSWARERGVACDPRTLQVIFFEFVWRVPLVVKKDVVHDEEVQRRAVDAQSISSINSRDEALAIFANIVRVLLGTAREVVELFLRT